jgi:ribosomal protein S27E
MKRKAEKYRKAKKKPKPNVYDEDNFPVVPCPLCGNPETTFHHEALQRVFFHCSTCSLISVHPKCYLSPEDEKKRYELHQNDGQDGHVKFLQQILVPSLKLFQTGWKGIDYGSGPNDVLAKCIEMEGYECVSFDSFFPSDVKIGSENDFVFSTEVFEHFHDTKGEIEKVLGLLKGGGLLCIMTALWNEDLDFATWYYMRDPTHDWMNFSQSYL